jgi:hypothetical protein
MKITFGLSKDLIESGDCLLPFKLDYFIVLSSAFKMPRVKNVKFLKCVQGRKSVIRVLDRRHHLVTLYNGCDE